MLVTNGFFVDRHPTLPETLVQINCRLEVSQHGTHADCLQKFRRAKQTVWRGREQYPGMQIKIRQSHRGWMRQYRIENGKPMPFDSNPAPAFRICMQKTCTQLSKHRLWKCPALAYWSQLDQRLNLDSIPESQLFRDYKACSPECGDNDLQTFFDTKAIPQCGLCPSRREPFHHPDPTQRSELQRRHPMIRGMMTFRLRGIPSFRHLIRPAVNRHTCHRNRIHQKDQAPTTTLRVPVHFPIGGPRIGRGRRNPKSP